MQDPIAAAFQAAAAVAAVPSAGESVAEQLECPRCHSTNTKFCYYNNYNLSQPRHYCKDCRRYWTRGGSLRNIPVGGGTRKNSKRSSTSATSSSSFSTSPPAPDPKRLATDPAPAPKPEPVSALYRAPVDPVGKMLEVSGSFSSLLQSTGQFGNLNFLDAFDSGGSGSVSGITEAESADPKTLNPDPHPQQQQQQPPPPEALLWSGGWTDLAIYTDPGSSFQ